MKILVPIDFSDCALKALAYAIELGQVTGSELVLFHAYHPPMGKQDTYYIDERVVDQEKIRIKCKMKRLSGTIPKLDQISHYFIISMALAIDGITEAIAHHHIDLVVMGTHGAQTPYDELLGSNTYAVIQRAACPVLAIPETFQKFQLRNLALAVDFQPTESHPSLTFLKTLAHTFKTYAHILHVNPHPATIGVQQGEEALAFDSMLQDVPHSYFFIEELDIEKGIEHYVSNYPIDMLVVMPKKHVLLDKLLRKSITRQLALHTHIPLLTLPFVNSSNA